MSNNSHWCRLLTTRQTPGWTLWSPDCPNNRRDWVKAPTLQRGTVRLERLSYFLRAREWWCWDWSETPGSGTASSECLCLLLPGYCSPPTSPSSSQSPQHTSYMGLVYRRPGRWLMQTQWAELQEFCLGYPRTVEAGKSQFPDFTNNITQKKKTVWSFSIFPYSICLINGFPLNKNTILKNGELNLSARVWSQELQ